MTRWALRFAMGCVLTYTVTNLLAVELPIERPDVSAIKTSAESTRPIEFTRDVQPALTKAGCNGGGCHGAFSGRGGFRLSLWGFDPVVDYYNLTIDAQGRRVSLAAPTESLILAKPLTVVPHEGGLRLESGSESYEILRQWIAQRVPAPKPDDPQLVRLEVISASVTLEPGTTTDALLLAHWSDGQSRDVSRWGIYDTTSEKVVKVSPLGKLTAVGPGRASITIRYQGHVAAIAVTVPYAKPSEPQGFAQANFIDRAVLAQWKEVGLLPTPLADDGEFLRRVYLDLIGTLPTVNEARAFLDSTDSQKRSKLIDALLERPEYADYWALKWGDLLRIHRRALGAKGVRSFSDWFLKALRENRPFDKIVHEIMSARGNLYASGPVAFYFINTTPQELAETSAQVFLGIRMQCARCHHHPFEVWSQDDYYGLAACFSQVQRKDTKELGRYGGAQSIQLAEETKLPHPTTGAPVPPRLLGQQPLEPKPGHDPREDLADWMTSPDNAYFAKNVVNRYWGYLMGRGLVDPIDDLRASNPASHPALLSELERDFVAHHFDLKHLLRTLTNSSTYQLATELTPARDADGVFFSHRSPRKMPAEVMLDAINQITMGSDSFESFPAGTRAMWLPDPAVDSYFLDVFGRPPRATNCECERSRRSDLRQVLHLANGDALQQKIARTEGRVAKLEKAGASDEAFIEDVYLAGLTRRPQPEEVTVAKQIIATAPSRREGWEDLMWTVLNLAEFSVNH
jgi:hypothetical protein